MTAPQNPPPAPGKKFRILLAEDNVVNRVLAQKLLQKNGHVVISANNGKEATTLWRDNRSCQFDLILMDIQMPFMDGLQATDYIRAQEKSSQSESITPQATALHIPIIAMTAHAMKGDRERYLAGGMDGYISKPINSAELEQVLQSVVAKFSPKVSAPATASQNIQESKPMGLEEAQILARFDGDLELARELAGMFIEECPKYLNDMREAVRAGDAHALERSAHSFKGSVGNFSTVGAHESALKLEMLGKSEDLTGASEILNLLQEQLAQFNQILERMTKDPVRHSA
jgi:two-component system, sensor histidine kinase and response regulator